MKLIPLTQGLFAQVDDDVFEWASKFKWYAARAGHTFYAAREIRLPNGKRSPQLLHRAVLKSRPGEQVDHKDGNGLNDRLENLRPCTNTENAQNRRKSCDNTSGYVGVCFDRRAGKFRADIRVSRARKFLGHFDTAKEAACARDKAAAEMHGEFARLNFQRGARMRNRGAVERAQK